MADRAHRRVGPIVRGVPALIAGTATGVLAGLALGPAAGFLVGWSVAALVYSVWALVSTWNLDAERTRRLARTEAPGRVLARVLSLLGAGASLAAVVLVLATTENAPPPLDVVLPGVCIVAVVASWLVIEVDHMLRLAAEYYADPIGGLDFNQSEPPMYSDFAYLAFTIGVTYQVSDNDVGSNRIRRLILAQSLLGYLFGAVILATIVNFVAGLGSS